MQLGARPEELAEAFGLDEVPELPPRYNIAPTQGVSVVRLRRPDPGSPPERRLVTMKWGLVPHFAKDATGGAKAINARAETVDSRPAFRDAFARHRCIVPATAFYEWRRTGSAKQPFMIRRRDGGLLGFAGLWARWKGGPEPLDTCAVITTAANDLVTPIHDRMPVVLPPGAYAAWLDPAAEPGRLKALLAPAPNDWLVAVPVSPRVNNVANDDAECAAEVAMPDVPAPRQGSLF
jgi:putative SOS response-associated peptidase YedK